MGKKKKHNKNCNKDKFSDYKIPPCAKFLGSVNPLIKDGEVIYRNYNRVYCFLSFNTNTAKQKEYNQKDPSTYNYKANGNLQIELYYFIIGVFINDIQKGVIKYDKDTKIHENEQADAFIKKILENDYTITDNFIPSLTLIISNSSAVIPVYTGTIEISPINYYIILMLSRSYGDYGMLYSDNAYITNDFINCTLANMYFEFN